MGAYELDECECHADIDGDGSVGFSDLLFVLDDYGEECPVFCRSDIDDDGEVTFTDLLKVLDDWGPCPCPGSGSADDCDDYDLGENCECRDTLTDLIENGTQTESENARCWLQHYIECHAPGSTCSGANCPDDDPCGKH